MASRPGIKTISRPAETEDVAQEAPNQRIRPDTGPYRLQVDRQTKATYTTQEAAEAAGLIIKKAHPVVQVSVYSSAKGVNKTIELPEA